jgi:uncharacterized protein (TIGR03435 family)
MKRIVSTLALMLVTVLGYSQTKLEFEVASIKPVSDQTPVDAVQVGLHVDGSQVRYTYLSLKEYIGQAYQVKLYQVSGPDWLAGQRFEIAAKLPDGSKISQVPEMLQNLLADRFALKLHRDSKEFPVYALEIAKSGLKMRESAPDSDSDPAPKAPSVNVAAAGSAQGVSVNLGGGSYYSFANNRLEGKKLTTARFVDILARFMDRPVIDQTGLTASYDFALDLTPEDYTAMLIRSAITAGVNLPPQALRALDFSSGDSLVNGLQKVGLSLTQKKAPLDVLVVDSVQKAPNN